MSKPAPLVRTALLLGALGCLCTGAASGQHLRGRIVDLENGAAIPWALLTLIGAEGDTAATAMSGADGLWRFVVPGPGLYRVAADRFGYEHWVSDAFALGAEDDFDSVYRLRPLPIELDPIEVQTRAAQQYLRVSGFYERQGANFGHFLGPEEIERRQASTVTDLLVTIPGVRRVALYGGSVGPEQIQLRGSNLSQGGICRPRVFVDGLLYSPGDAQPVRLREGEVSEETVDDMIRRIDRYFSLDDLGHPSTIAGIEVYRSASQVPVQFGGSSVETLCGVVVVWTRTGRMRTGGG